MWKILNFKGYIPNKNLILKFPKESIFSSKDLIKHYIRGYVNGDGTLGVYPHSKSKSKIRSIIINIWNYIILEGVQKYLGIEGFLMQKPNFNILTYRLGYNTRKTKTVAEIL